uniref:Uncharacterized protein n=1 Tax=Streptomyces rimofaciens TaxID=504097 RepID=H9BDW5_9ACTN|nr:hypothetical protein [Streptomyces rimofaciens]
MPDRSPAAEPLILDVGSAGQLAELAGDLVDLAGPGGATGPWVLTWAHGAGEPGGEPGEGQNRGPNGGTGGGPGGTVARPPGATVVRHGGLEVVTVPRPPRDLGGFLDACCRTGPVSGHPDVTRTILILADPTDRDRSASPPEAPHDAPRDGARDGRP